MVPNNQIMFVCRACTKRASTNVLRRLPGADIRLAAPPRTFATNPIRRQLPPVSEPQNLSSDWGQLEDVVEKEADKIDNNKAFERQKALEKMTRAVKIELYHTKDPYHIADNVRRKLEDNEFDKALMMTREASKDKQVVVCWNYLIAHEFTRQRLHAALKLYNEMKKRAQLPNAQTYTTIFRGCSESRHPKLAVTEALRIYNTMLASSRLKPNQIHMNAVLDLCSKAGDIESMFVALRTANGIRSPDSTTYTIILNALRNQPENVLAPKDCNTEPNDEIKASRAKTISRSRLVWEEVITRWKKGEVAMDEALMCAMGRVLLLGGAAETDAILGILAEVLDIRTLKDGKHGFVDPATQKKLPDEIPKQSKTPEKRIETAAQFEDSDEGGDFDSSRPAEARHAAPLPSNHHSNNLRSPSVKGRMAGNNTLSLVMRALAQARRTKLAARYWDYLVQVHDIVPDRRNYRDYIDCLSTGNASSKAARVLSSMPASIQDGNLYRRGLLLCHWDAFNESAFDNATAILRAMIRKLRIPDARCLKLYLEVAMTSHRKFSDTQNYPNEREGKLAHAKQIIFALDEVFEPAGRATADINFTNAALAESPQESWRDTWPLRQEILEFMQQFISATDKVLSGNLIDKRDEDFRILRTRRNVYHRKIDMLAEGNRKYGGQGTRIEYRNPEKEKGEFSVSF